MPATLKQQTDLFNLLKFRGEKGMLGLSMPAMVRTVDLDGEGQLIEALKTLESAGLIRVDIWGRFPAIVVLKDKWRNGNDVLWNIPPGAEPKPQPKHDEVPPKMGPVALVDMPIDPTKIIEVKGSTEKPELKKGTVEVVKAQVPAKAVEPVKMPPYKFQEPAKGPAVNIVPAPKPKPVKAKKPAPVIKEIETFAPPPAPAPTPTSEPPVSAVVAAIRMEPTAPIFVATETADPNLISFTLTDIEWAALGEACDRHEHPILLPAFAKHLCLTELDRLLSADAPKHRLSAEIFVAAREDGRPVLDFVSDMILVGMKAREMNRKGF